jgi:hypothetical protein
MNLRGLKNTIRAALDRPQSVRAAAASAAPVLGADNLTKARAEGRDEGLREGAKAANERILQVLSLHTVPAKRDAALTLATKAPNLSVEAIGKIIESLSAAVPFVASADNGPIMKLVQSEPGNAVASPRQIVR